MNALEARIIAYDLTIKSLRAQHANPKVIGVRPAREQRLIGVQMERLADRLDKMKRKYEAQKGERDVGAGTGCAEGPTGP